MQFRSRLKIRLESSQVSRAEPSVFTFSLVRVSALRSLNTDICGLFQHKWAAVVPAAKNAQTSKAAINFRWCEAGPILYLLLEATLDPRQTFYCILSN